MRVFSARAQRLPVDYGVAPIGTIRFFTVPPGTCGPWYIQQIVSHDRTLSEWISLIKTWQTGVLPEKYDAPLSSGNPFTTQRAAAKFLIELLAKELKLRWVARKFVARLRERVYARRTVGADCDLYTTLPVPAHSQVVVRDRTSRTQYVFHVKTAIENIRTGLMYSNYGIACPQAPKNPYTNKPWSYAQLLTIVSQILAHTYLSLRTKHPQDIFDFRKCDHDISKYFEQHKEAIQLHGATEFFKEIHNSDLNYIRLELIDDFYETVGHDICSGWRTVRAFALERLLSDELNKRWNKLLSSSWIYLNFQKVVNYESHDSMIEDFLHLHTESYAWWNAQPKHLLRRPQSHSDDLEYCDSE
jgi:hypothetical protein